MNINIKKVARMALLLFAGAMTAVTTGCSEDEFTSRGDLFQPKFAADPKVVNNDVSLIWYMSNDAIGYTVQLFEDTYYESKFMEFDIEGRENCFVTIEDLPYGKQFYARVRCNAKEAKHNSLWGCQTFTTERRPAFAQLLNGVDRTTIDDNNAVITWTIDPENPVDSISIVCPTMPELEPVGGYLTAAEQAAGTYRAANLRPNTLYQVTIFDTSKPRKYDKPYNKTTFRTTGPDPDVITVGATDDLSQMLIDNNLDDDVVDGTVYLLEDGSVYEIAPFAMKKGFVIRGPEDAEAKPVITMNGTWTVASGASISIFSLQNIQIGNKADGQYFFNCANSYVMEQALFTNVTFKGLKRGFWRHQYANDKHIMEFTMDNCMIDLCGFQSSGYGTFTFGSFGKNGSGWGYNDAVDKMTFSNCTFSRDGYVVELGGNTTWGFSNFIEYATTINPVDLTMENCTFYEYCHNKTLIDMSWSMGSFVTLRNIVMASPCGQFIVTGPDTELVTSNNYCTRDYTMDASGFGASKYAGTAKDLMKDPMNGDLTITDKASKIYTTGAGDPRWIK